MTQYMVKMMVWLIHSTQGLCNAYTGPDRAQVYIIPGIPISFPAGAIVESGIGAWLDLPEELGVGTRLCWPSGELKGLPSTVLTHRSGEGDCSMLHSVPLHVGASEINAEFSESRTCPGRLRFIWQIRATDSSRLTEECIPIAFGLTSWD